MLTKICLLFLIAVCVSANPAANGPWRWVHKRMMVDPISKLPSVTEVENSAAQKRSRLPTPTVKVANCGTSPLYPNGLYPSIVGGYEARPHAFPWQVMLNMDSGFFCSGSIISDEWIVTASHCMVGARSVMVTAGAHDLSVQEASQVVITSTDFFTHEEYNPTNFHNDIAMIRLPSKLTFNEYIQPVCLPSPDEEDLPAGVWVNPTGWGNDGYNNYPNKLQAVWVITITNEECVNSFGNIISDGMICTDGSEYTGTCSGDSGGPLNYKVDLVTEIRGIVSFGSAAGCLSGYANAFTRVSHYLDWIQSHSGVTR